MASIAIAVGYLCVAAVSAFLPAADRAGAWLPIHLALAGAASTAIAGVMPFFSAAFAMAPPSDARVRWTSVIAVATGAAVVSIGFVADLLVVAAVGGVAYVSGASLVVVATVRPARRGLGPRGGLVTRGYVAALLMVIAGAALATLFLAGWPPVVEAWGRLRPAHAWLNLVGFVSLVVATTLLHFFPTVIGARIQRIRSAHVTVGGLALGSLFVALGFAWAADALARLGALGVLVGGGALASYCLAVWRARARWTSDHDWHLFAMGGLVSAVAWFELGLVVAAGRVVVGGADTAAVSTDLLIGPLVLGWVGLAIMASATHLVPAVGPGHPVAHARQRRVLGRGARPRLIAADAGVAAISLGLPWRLDLLTLTGAVLVTGALVATSALVVRAVALGLRDQPPAERVRET